MSDSCLADVCQQKSGQKMSQHCISISSYEDDGSNDSGGSLYGSILWDLRELPKYLSSKWRCVLHSNLLVCFSHDEVFRGLVRGQNRA
jgi:hypothetical protein